MSEAKRRVTLRFKRKELLHDIANIGYVEGDLQSEEEKQHDSHQTQDIVEDGNVERVTRRLDLAYTTCVECLRPYTNVDLTEDIEIDDTYSETEMYEIVLEVESSFTRLHAEHLKNLIHEYLICEALGDWLSVTKVKASENWYLKAEKAMEEAQATLYTSGRCIEREYGPLG